MPHTVYNNKLILQLNNECKLIDKFGGRDSPPFLTYLKYVRAETPLTLRSSYACVTLLYIIKVHFMINI